MDQTSTIESRFEELRANFDNLNNSLQEILSEELDLETAGITAINERLGKLGDLKTSIRSLFDEANNAYNHGTNGGNSRNAKILTQDEFINLASSIQEFIKAQEAKSAELRAERERKENIRKLISDKIVELNNQLAEYDAKEKEAKAAIEHEKEILEGELSESDRKYHEALLAAAEEYLEALTNERAPLDEQHEKWTNEMAILLNGGELHYDLVDGELVEREEGATLKMGTPEETPEAEAEEEVKREEEELPPAPVPGHSEDEVIEEHEVENDLPPAPVPGLGEDEELPPAPEPVPEEVSEENAPELPPFVPLVNPISSVAKGKEDDLPPAPEALEEAPAARVERELPPLAPMSNPVNPVVNEGMEEGLPPAPEAVEETPAAPEVNPNDDTASLTTPGVVEAEEEEVERVTDPNPSLWIKVGVALLALANAFLAAIAAHTAISAKKARELLDKFANQQTDDDNKEDEKKGDDDQQQIPSDGEVEPSNPEKEPENPEKEPENPEKEPSTEYEEENGLPIYLAEGELAVQKNPDGTKTEVNHDGEVYTHEQDGSYSYEGKNDLNQVNINGTTYSEVGQNDFNAPAEPQKTGQEQSFEQASQNMSAAEMQNALAAIQGVPAEDLVAPEPGTVDYYTQQQEETSEELASYDWSRLLGKGN